MTATLLGKIAVCIGQAFVAAYYYGRVLCAEKTFRRVWIVLGALQREGLVLARRTIAKYREELRIPTSNQRKVLY